MLSFIMVSWLLCLCVGLFFFSLVADIVHAFVWFCSFCFACAALFGSVYVFIHLQSRSLSREGDEQLGEVREEEEAGERGRGVREEGAFPEESKGSDSEGDRDQEKLEDLMEKEEDLHQRSISETDLR